MYSKLSINQLVKLVPEPTYNEIKKYEELNIGSYTGGFVDEFRMDLDGIKVLPRPTIIELITTCGYENNPT